MNIQDELDESPQINIVPMIDVIFAILTFFIMASLFLTRSEGLPVNLPKAETSQSQEQDRATVTIEASGQMFLDRQPIQVEQLSEELQLLKGDRSTLLVIIDADEEVNHGNVVAAMDQLRQVEGVTVGLSTTRPAP